MTRYDVCSQAEACPGCGQIDGVEQTSSTPRVTAWKCTRCQMSWAISHGQRPAYFEQLAATVQEVGRLRWLLGQVVTLADDATGLTDEQLRTRLLALAESCPVNRLARWWAISPLDCGVHLLAPEGDHPPGGLKARCGHLLPTAVHQHDQPPLGSPCEHCRLIFLADFTTTPGGSTHPTR